MLCNLSIIKWKLISKILLFAEQGITFSITISINDTNKMAKGLPLFYWVFTKFMNCGRESEGEGVANKTGI